MKLLWDESAWEEYCYWQVQDKKTLAKINKLIKDIMRNPYDGLGKPEPLKGDLSGSWSRRIDSVNRITYYEENGIITIASCKGHYDD